MLPLLTLDRARVLIAEMAQARLLVLGDVMLDQFIVGRVSRISPEAPVPIVAFERDDYRAGGAANVALNVRALGASVDLIGLVGADDAGARLRDLLHASGVSASALVTDEKRRTTTKVRIVTTRNQQVARVDYETDDLLAAPTEAAIIRQLESYSASAGAVIVSDYLKGFVTRHVMAAIVSIAHQRAIPVLIDPKIPHLDYYAGATLVTPNHHEAEAATHLRIRGDEEARAAARRFRELARCESVLITRGEQGMWLTADGIEGQLPASAREVSDVTGAGDTVVATLGLALAAGATPAEAACLANEAAGIVVGKFGPATVSGSELMTKFSG